jgi:protein-S-isoprenylcysteine O-methyltransferase Ste14
MNDTRDNPGVIVFPPLLFAGTLVVGLLLHWWMPRPILPHHSLRAVGVLLMVLSIIIASWGRTTMVKGGTNINPKKPSTAIVTEGPFRFSRNPLYGSLTGMYLDITFLINALWPLLLLFPLLVVTHYGIIRREEHYLDAKFGDSYRTYKARVRRWF